MNDETYHRMIDACAEDLSALLRDDRQARYEFCREHFERLTPEQLRQAFEDAGLSLDEEEEEA